MSNLRPFLVPLNYDIKKQIYPTEEVVHKKEYHMTEVKSPKQYHQLYTSTFASETPKFYADKLRHRAKFR